MEMLSESSSSLVPASILSLIGGSLIIIGALVPLGMLGISGHYGMMSGTGGMMGGGFGMMMVPLQSFIWTTMAVLSVISIVTGAVLIVGGYSIYGKRENAGKWGVTILVASVVSLFSMGGFFIGPILGIIGGILALTKK